MTSSNKTLNSVLFCVLNWGLGHASRSTPVIQLLLNKGIKVSLASSGMALQLLKKEFPELEFYNLPDYEIEYSKHGIALSLKLFSQFKKLTQAIKSEQGTIQNIIKQQHFDLIISDSRFGCFSQNAPNVILTHQLNIQAPIGSSIINKRYHQFLKPFQQIWVPDKSHKLSGKLSISQLKFQEIGFLSAYCVSNKPKDIDCLIVLSGPEPQRTILEEKLLTILPKEKKCVLVRGTNKEQKNKHNDLTAYNLTSPNELEGLLNRAKLVVSRAGYSSLMDYKVLGLPAVIIPTPGQTEQLYLIKHLVSDSQFKPIKQSQVDSNIFEFELNFESKKSPNINAEAIINSLQNLGFKLA